MAKKNRSNRIEKKRRDRPDINNPVAKYAHKTNRCIAFRDRSKYTRKAKHNGHESWPMAVVQPLLARTLVFAW
jgi:hypothetical protein